MAISREVKTFIHDYKAPLKKELSYIKKNDWTIETSRFKRINKHKTNYLLINRSLDKLKYFHKIAQDDLHLKEVKEFVNLIVEFFKLYAERYERYVNIEDWTQYSNIYGDDEKGQEELMKNIEEEVSFQSNLLKNINDCRIILDGLNLEGESRKLELPIYSDIPAPFLLREKLIKLFPEIKNHMNEQK